jgi:hypothetical protein
LTLGTQGRVGAALTTTERVGTTRRVGSGEQDERCTRVEPVVEPPQVQNRLQSGGYGPGWAAAHVRVEARTTPTSVNWAGQEAMGKVCGVPMARLQACRDHGGLHLRVMHSNGRATPRVTVPNCRDPVWSMLTGLAGGKGFTWQAAPKWATTRVSGAGGYARRRVSFGPASQGQGLSLDQRESIRPVKEKSPSTSDCRHLGTLDEHKCKSRALETGEIQFTRSSPPPDSSPTRTSCLAWPPGSEAAR